MKCSTEISLGKADALAHLPQGKAGNGRMGASGFPSSRVRKGNTSYCGTTQSPGNAGHVVRRYRRTKKHSWRNAGHGNSALETYGYAWVTALGIPKYELDPHTEKADLIS